MSDLNYHENKIKVLRRIAFMLDECNRNRQHGELMIRVDFHKGDLSKKIKFSPTTTEIVL